MTGVADTRVVAVVPIVIDVVNVDPSLRHHAEAYGFWAEAIAITISTASCNVSIIHA